MAEIGPTMNPVHLARAEFLVAVAGKRIVDVEVRDKDSLGHQPRPGEVIVTALVLDDGTCIELGASGQIGYDDVWAVVVPPPQPGA